MIRSLSDLRTAHYSSLFREEWEYLSEIGIVNGFGPNEHPVLQSILNRISPAFRRSNANIHDFCYWQGGDEAQRLKCDKGFFSRLIQDSLDTKWYKCPYYLVLSVVYFLAVRIFGRKYFFLKQVTKVQNDK